EKDTSAFFCRGAGRIHPLLSLSLLLPTTLPCQNINRNLYNSLSIIIKVKKRGIKIMISKILVVEDDHDIHSLLISCSSEIG
ncbi:hypothetical protein ABEX18_12800, partial [Aneurinibacillus migulanus]|uniref:hypothetical protein n=2 Tax=Aneurinibacillus migulanus TaxID=47500 RepID=UPI003D199544